MLCTCRSWVALDRQQLRSRRFGHAMELSSGLKTGTAPTLCDCFQISSSQENDRRRFPKRRLSAMASCTSTVQQCPAAAIAILGQDELGQVFKHVALLDFFSLGLCQTVCRQWKSLAQSEELYHLAYKTHVPAPCHRLDLVDGKIETYMAVGHPLLLPEALTRASLQFSQMGQEPGKASAYSVAKRSTSGQARY